MSENEMNEIQRALMELGVHIKHMDTKQDQMIDDLKSIKEAIYNPETGLYARVRDLEQWQQQHLMIRLIFFPTSQQDWRIDRIRTRICFYW